MGFRRRSAMAQHDLHYGPNMTPMVDVVMVILVFFMASAAFLGPEWFLRTAIPRPAPAVADAERVTWTLRLSRPANITSVRVNELPEMTIEAVEAWMENQLRSISRDRITVIISPEAPVPYDEVVRAHEICARKGIKRVGLAGGEK